MYNINHWKKCIKWICVTFQDLKRKKDLFLTIISSLSGDWWQVLSWCTRTNATSAVLAEPLVDYNVSTTWGSHWSLYPSNTPKHHEETKSVAFMIMKNLDFQKMAQKTPGWIAMWEVRGALWHLSQVQPAHKTPVQGTRVQKTQPWQKQDQLTYEDDT